MARLPDSDWISLAECRRRALAAFGQEEPSAVETALLRAFADGKIGTEGRCPAYLNHNYINKLHPGEWDVSRVEVNWDGNSFVNKADPRKLWTFTDVSVTRDLFERWLGPQEQVGAACETAQNKGGRPAKYNWEAAINATWAAIWNGDLKEDDRPSWDRYMTDWLSSQDAAGNSPSDSDVRKRCKMIQEAILALKSKP